MGTITCVLQWTAVSSAHLRGQVLTILEGQEAGLPTIERERLAAVDRHVVHAMLEQGHGTCIMMLGLDDVRHKVCTPDLEDCSCITSNAGTILIWSPCK